MATDLDALFQQLYRDLIAWCVRHSSKQWGDPEDFVHQAYCKCRKHWSAGCSTPGREAAYVYRALRWVLLDAARQHQRRRRFMAVSADAADRRAERSASVVSAHAVSAQAVSAEEAFRSLTPRERAICRGYLLGHSQRRVCFELGLSLGALGAHLSRARHKLLREFGVGRRTSAPPGRP